MFFGRPVVELNDSSAAVNIEQTAMRSDIVAVLAAVADAVVAEIANFAAAFRSVVDIIDANVDETDIQAPVDVDVTTPVGAVVLAVAVGSADAVNIAAKSRTRLFLHLPVSQLAQSQRN